MPAQPRLQRDGSEFGRLKALEDRVDRLERGRLTQSKSVQVAYSNAFVGPLPVGDNFTVRNAASKIIYFVSMTGFNLTNVAIAEAFKIDGNTAATSQLSANIATNAHLALPSIFGSLGSLSAGTHAWQIASTGATTNSGDFFYIFILELP